MDITIKDLWAIVDKGIESRKAEKVKAGKFMEVEALASSLPKIPKLADYAELIKKIRDLIRR